MTEEFDFGERSLEGRVILVVGGSGGLGSVTSALLASEGARVVIGYHQNRDRAAKLRRTISERFGTQVELLGGDIAQPQVRRRYLSLAQTLGSLYGLVCFSGAPSRVKLAEADVEALTDSMLHNYFGPLLLARDVAARMKEEGDGSIVLLASMQATALFENSHNYAGAKVALLHAARIMAREWGGPGGLRVNVVAPGVNRAGMALESIKSGKYDSFVDEGVIPRFGKPIDVARVVRLLMEPDNYITGQVITVDGGLTLRR